jgi:hypothetical protein
MRHNRRGSLALLFVVPALAAGCGGASSSSPTAAKQQQQQVLTNANEQRVVTRLAKTYGPAYVEASKNLPDQIETR